MIRNCIRNRYLQTDSGSLHGGSHSFWKLKVKNSASTIAWNYSNDQKQIKILQSNFTQENNASNQNNKSSYIIYLQLFQVSSHRSGTLKSTPFTCSVCACLYALGKNSWPLSRHLQQAQRHSALESVSTPTTSRMANPFQIPGLIHVSVRMYLCTSI